MRDKIVGYTILLEHYCVRYLGDALHSDIKREKKEIEIEPELTIRHKIDSIDRLLRTDLKTTFNDGFRPSLDRFIERHAKNTGGEVLCDMTFSSLPSNAGSLILKVDYERK